MSRIENVWYRDFVLARETERGLDDRDDNLAACTFAMSLAPGESVTLAMGAGRGAGIPRFPRLGRCAPRRTSRWSMPRNSSWCAVRCGDDPDAYSIIAGYHWFGDWGRDTAISLPGLTLATGRFDIAKKILTTLAGFVDGGMLPNIMPGRRRDTDL